MHDAQPMCGIERIDDLDCTRQREVERPQRSALETRSQRLAFQILHDQERDAVLVADVVHGADVRVNQGGDHLRFAVESRTERRVAGERRRQDLHGDRTVQACVGREIDLSHATASDEVLDAVRT